MIKTQTILVIDTGSSSMKGLLLDLEGNIIGRHKISYAMSIEGDSATQDPEVFSSALREICRTYIKNYNNCHISAIALTSQRSSVVPADKNGNPLDKFMLWYDKRSWDICNEINDLYGEEIYKTCGMMSIPVLSAPKIKWIRINKPDVYASCYKFLGIHDYLVHQLTSEFVTDTTLASRTNLMDINTGRWSDRMFEIYGIDSGKMCDVVSAGSQVGSVTKKFSDETGILPGTPVISAGGDQQCSVLGSGLTRDCQIGVTVGTGAYVAGASSKPVFDAEKRVHTCIGAVPGSWVIEASSPAAGSICDWSRKVLFGEDSPVCEMDRALSAAPPGANGVIMLAEHAGQGCLHNYSEGRGVYLNMSLGTSKSDLARASFEGVVAEIADCCRVLVELLHAEKSIIITTGGLSRLPLFNQVLSDMLLAEVRQSRMEDTTALGAWAQAAAAVGAYSGPEDAVSAVMRDYVCYQPDENLHRLYLKQDRVRDHFRKRLPYDDIKKILAQGDPR